jgi:FAT domain
MVRAQMLSELEEIIAYKQFADQPERQQTIRKTWVKRFAPLSIHVPLLKVVQTPGMSA